MKSTIIQGPSIRQKDCSKPYIRSCRQKDNLHKINNCAAFNLMAITTVKLRLKVQLEDVKNFGVTNRRKQVQNSSAYNI